MARMTETQQLRDAITARNDLASPLLRLPAEIRNLIYGYVFSKGNYTLIKIKRGGRYRVVVRECDRRTTALLETCKQLHEEAAAIPFNIKTFNFRSYDLPGYSKLLKEVNRAQMKNMHFDFDVGYPLWAARGWAAIREQGLNSLHDILPGVSNVHVTLSGVGPDRMNEVKEAMVQWLQGDSTDKVKVTFKLIQEVFPKWSFGFPGLLISP